MGKIIGLIFEDSQDRDLEPENTQDHDLEPENTQDSALTKAEIMERLKQKGIDFDEKAKKDELLSLLSES